MMADVKTEKVNDIQQIFRLTAARFGSKSSNVFTVLHRKKNT